MGMTGLVLTAGAINGTMIAAGTPDFGPTTAGLARMWERLAMSSVVRTDARTLGGRAFSLVRDLILGPVLGRTVTHALLDIGYHDAGRRAAEIEPFLCGEAEADAGFDRPARAVARI